MYIYISTHVYVYIYICEALLHVGIHYKRCVVYIQCKRHTCNALSAENHMQFAIESKVRIWHSVITDNGSNFLIGFKWVYFVGMENSVYLK